MPENAEKKTVNPRKAYRVEDAPAEHLDLLEKSLTELEDGDGDTRAPGDDKA